MHEKNKPISVRLDEEEYNYLKELVNRTGKTQSVCIRNLIDASRKKEKVNFVDKNVYLQRKELINEINRIGHNINQIVHNANMEYYTPYDKSKLFALMQKLNNILEEKLGK